MTVPTDDNNDSRALYRIVITIMIIVILTPTYDLFFIFFQPIILFSFIAKKKIAQR